MSHFGSGFVPVRRGVMDHVFDGRMTPPEHHAFLSMLCLADAATGTWRGSAPALTTVLGYTSKNTMAEALDALEAKGYILRDYAPGRRGNFPILIGKLLLTRGVNAGKRVDLAATKRQYGIPEGRLSKLTRKPLFTSIAAACSHPVLVSETDDGVDRGVRSSTVSRPYTGMSERRSEGFAQTPDSTSGFAEQEENPESPFAPESDAERPAPAHPQGSHVPPVQPESTFATSASPTPQMPAAEQLATLFFSYQGRPARFNNPASYNLWVSAFTLLIAQYGYDTLSGAMDWVFNVDAFWPQHLIRPDNPIGYFEQKLADQILPRYLGWKKAQENLSTKKQQQQNRKEGINDNANTRPGTQRAGRQPVDNRAAAEEAKRRIAERLGSAG